ncbi:MAG: DUF2341 domain-containing protein [Elusimicrobiota bacterium]
MAGVLYPWLNGSKYRKPITITNNTGSILIDYQVMFTLDTMNLISNSKMQSDGKDMRLTDSDGITQLDYWVEGGINTESTTTWVKVPFVSTNSKTIYLYYGNESMVTNSSTNTFIREINTNTPVKGAWRIDEISGASVVDYSGNNNIGTAYGTMIVDGKFNKARNFNGNGDCVDIPDTDVLTLGTAATFTSWVNITTISENYSSIINKWNQAVDDEYIFGVNTNNTLVLAWHTNGGGNWGSSSWYSVNSVGTITLGEWAFVAVVRNNTTITFYINGVEAGSSNPIDINPFRNGLVSVRIGGQNRSRMNRTINGNIDETHIYSRALAAEEIADIYNNYGYVTTNYIGRELVRKFTSPEPTTAVGAEDSLITKVGNAADWSWKIANYGELIKNGGVSNWQWKTFTNDETSITVPRGLAADWYWCQ